jgi:CBS domain-containing protein
MRIQEVMTTAVRTVAPGTTAADAWELMRQAGIRHLVVTQGGSLIGLVSDRDLGGSRGATMRAGKTVADLMTEDVVTVSPETPVRKAANVMRGRSIGCLVVATGSRISGIVTVADLLELLGRGAERPVATSRRPTLNHRVPHTKQHQSTGRW